MENDSLLITRTFDASREQVWKAWTDSEMIKKWWGPEGFTAPSVKIDLRVGGKYIFAMHGSVGSEWDKDMYSAGVFNEIVPGEKIVAVDFFSDENGEFMEPTDQGQDPNFPKKLSYTVLFEELEDGKTKLSIIYKKPETEEQFEALKKSGMEEGWQSSLNKFEAALKGGE